MGYGGERGNRQIQSIDLPGRGYNAGHRAIGGAGIAARNPGGEFLSRGGHKAEWPRDLPIDAAERAPRDNGGAAE
eukprot:11193448-Lingulodinium_polyedra.AAC.1